MGWFRNVLAAVLAALILQGGSRTLRRRRG